MTMTEIAGIPLGLRFAGFEFSPAETLLLVTCVATALVSIFELVRLSGRERMQQRIAALRGSIVERNETVRAIGVPWYDRLGTMIAKSPLVGIGEQRRLATKLAAAGIGGPGRVATLIAVRFLCALIGALVVVLALAS